MRNIFLKIHNYLKGVSPIKFIFISFVSTYLIVIPFIPIYIYYTNNIGDRGGPSFIGDNFVFDFFTAVIFAPIFETFLNQLAVIRLGEDFLKIENKYILVLLSALVFGLGHYYSLIYIFQTFLIGLILAYSFILYDDTKHSAF